MVGFRGHLSPPLAPRFVSCMRSFPLVHASYDVDICQITCIQVRHFPPHFLLPPSCSEHSLVFFNNISCWILFYLAQTTPFHLSSVQYPVSFVLLWPVSRFLSLSACVPIFRLLLCIPECRDCRSCFTSYLSLSLVPLDPVDPGFSHPVSESTDVSRAANVAYKGVHLKTHRFASQITVFDSPQQRDSNSVSFVAVEPFINMPMCIHCIMHCSVRIHLYKLHILCTIDLCRFNEPLAELPNAVPVEKQPGGKAGKCSEGCGEGFQAARLTCLTAIWTLTADHACLII